MPIKILIILFAVFALWRTIVKYRKNEVTLVETISWALLWTILAVAAIIPQTTDSIAKLVGVSRGVDLFVYISIIIIFFIVFKVIVKLEKIERNIARIVRHLSLDKIKDSDESE